MMKEIKLRAQNVILKVDNHTISQFFLKISKLVNLKTLKMITMNLNDYLTSKLNKNSKSQLLKSGKSSN